MIPARFMFIGISAGQLGALKTSVPFTKDASGRLFQRCLFRLALSKSDEHSTAPEYVDCYVTNFVKGQCLTNEGLNRLPTDEEFRHWWPSLEHEIQQVQPKLIIAVGDLVYRKLISHLPPKREEMKVIRAKHPRWYHSHGALKEGSPAFERMVEDYEHILNLKSKDKT